MKKLIFLLLLSAVCFGQSEEWVNGYVTSNGTIVGGYWRTTKDNTINNNYGTEGNVNPHTGKIGTIPREEDNSYLYNLPDLEKMREDAESQQILYKIEGTQLHGQDLTSSIPEYARVYPVEEEKTQPYISPVAMVGDEPSPMVKSQLESFKTGSYQPTYYKEPAKEPLYEDFPEFTPALVFVGLGLLALFIYATNRMLS